MNQETRIKIKLKKFKVSVILEVESDGMICISVNLKMSLFIILLSRTISSTCFGSDLTLRTRIVRVLSERLFLFIVEKK